MKILCTLTLAVVAGLAGPLARRAPQECEAESALQRAKEQEIQLARDLEQQVALREAQIAQTSGVLEDVRVQRAALEDQTAVEAQELRAKEQDVAALRARIEDLRAALAAREAELAKKQAQQADVRVAELRALVADHEAQKDALETDLTSLQQRVAQVRSQADTSPAREVQLARERAELEAHMARERAELETQVARERAENEAEMVRREAQLARERAEIEANVAREMAEVEAQEGRRELERERRDLERLRRDLEQQRAKLERELDQALRGSQRAEEDEQRARADRVRVEGRVERAPVRSVVPHTEVITTRRASECCHCCKACHGACETTVVCAHCSGAVGAHPKGGQILIRDGQGVEIIEYADLETVDKEKEKARKAKEKAAKEKAEKKKAEKDKSKSTGVSLYEVFTEGAGDRPSGVVVDGTGAEVDANVTYVVKGGESYTIDYVGKPIQVVRADDSSAPRIVVVRPDGLEVTDETDPKTQATDIYVATRDEGARALDASTVEELMNLMRELREEMRGLTRDVRALRHDIGRIGDDEPEGGAR